MVYINKINYFFTTEIAFSPLEKLAFPLVFFTVFLFVWVCFLLLLVIIQSRTTLHMCGFFVFFVFVFIFGDSICVSLGRCANGQF